MKTVFQWLLVAACLFTVGNVQVMAEGEKKKEEVKTVPIPLTIGDHTTNHVVRELMSIPFTAYYQAGSINVNTSAELSVITLNVANGTTGQVWSITTDISDGMSEISIANGASGSYTVEILTEYGECFVGSFSLK